MPYIYNYADEDNPSFMKWNVGFQCSYSENVKYICSNLAMAAWQWVSINNTRTIKLKQMQFSFNLFLYICFFYIKMSSVIYA